jgi:hypothetical protein
MTQTKTPIPTIHIHPHPSLPPSLLPSPPHFPHLGRPPKQAHHRGESLPFLPPFLLLLLLPSLLLLLILGLLAPFGVEEAEEPLLKRVLERAGRREGGRERGREWLMNKLPSGAEEGREGGREGGRAYLKVSLVSWARRVGAAETPKASLQRRRSSVRKSRT